MCRRGGVSCVTQSGLFHVLAVIKTAFCWAAEDGRSERFAGHGKSYLKGQIELYGESRGRRGETTLRVYVASRTLVVK